LALYGDKSNGPRPESYREDIISASIFKTDEEKEEHFSELKAAAESGMDFSSRWFIKKSKNEG
jgi:alpha,alpha-trehalase